MAYILSKYLGRVVVDVVDHHVDGEGAEAVGRADDRHLDVKDARRLIVRAERVPVERAARPQDAGRLVDGEQTLMSTGQHGELQPRLGVVDARVGQDVADEDCAGTALFQDVVAQCGGVCRRRQKTDDDDEQA